MPNGYPVVQRSTTSAPVTLPWPRIGMQTNFVNAFISAARFRIPAEFMCLPRVIDRPMPKKITPNLARFIRSAMSCSFSTDRPISATRSLSTGWFLMSARSVVDDLEVFARLDLQEDVRGFRARRLADIDQDHRPALAALGDELTLLGDGVLAEMPRVAFRRVPAPVDDEVRPVLDFA